MWVPFRIIRFNGSFSYMKKKSVAPPWKIQDSLENKIYHCVSNLLKVLKKWLACSNYFFFFSLSKSTPMSLTLIIYTKQELSCKELFPAYTRPRWELLLRWAHPLICTTRFPTEERLLWYRNDGMQHGSPYNLTYSHTRGIFMSHSEMSLALLEHHTSIFFLTSLLLQAITVWFGWLT